MNKPKMVFKVEFPTRTLHYRADGMIYEELEGKLKGFPRYITFLFHGDFRGRPTTDADFKLLMHRARAAGGTITKLD